MPQFKLRLSGRTLPMLPGRHDVGRLQDCWLHLDDELVSRYHARFHVDDERVDLEDLGSRNGTYVNGERVIGRQLLRDGDKVRIGREVMTLLGAETTSEEPIPDLRRTLSPEENTHLPALIGQLVEKSLKVGKLKDAERYALALANQLMVSNVSNTHPTAQSCVGALVSLAERSASGVWIDRVFRLYAVQGWVMSHDVLERIRLSLDRIPRVPGRGMLDYEDRLKQLAREGSIVPTDLSATISELVDAYGET